MPFAAVRLRSLALCIFTAALAVPALAGTSAISFDANQDRHPDLAVLRQFFTNRGLAEYAFEIHLSGTRLATQVEGFSAVPGATLEHWDVDGDHDRDIILLSPSGVALRVWLNDGMGRFVAGDLSDYDCTRESRGPIAASSSAHTFGMARAIASTQFVQCPNSAGRIVKAVRCRLTVSSIPCISTWLHAELLSRPPPSLA